ncbi:O-antigen ligase family protein [Pseudomonas sp. B21-012]|uniref:O-antigen ligase family protein n=1 Tax=Pseudomonas sp. B21-012 TaxID=2895472 RepID=UPI00215E0F95|nr:O-antigen ligase family protein [Pseudomonas sp. B21-012]UVM54573.1 O-antigen ligase family protein [Pseudomonas sp. B21-012]
MGSYWNDDNRWRYLTGWVLALGLFVLISGKVWLTSGSARNSQVYFLLLLPALVYAIAAIASRKVRMPGLCHWIWSSYLVWVALSGLWATGSERDVLALAKRGVFIALFMAAVHILVNGSPQVFRKALYAAVIVVALGALATLFFQFYWLDRPLHYRAFRLDRLGIGDFANYRYPVAAGMFHGAIASWAFALAVDRTTSLRKAVAWMAVFLVLAAYVLLTYARGAWIGLAASCLVAILLQRSKLGWWILGAGLLVSLGVAVIWKDHVLNELLTRRLSGRSPIWEYFFSSMSGSWLVGHGLGTPFAYHWPDGKTVSPHAHSLYLQQVYDSGLIALGLLLAGLACVFKKAWSMRRDPLICLTLPALCYALIVMLTDVERIFTRPGDYWTIVWLPLAVLLAVTDQGKNRGSCTGKE